MQNGKHFVSSQPEWGEKRRGRACVCILRRSDYFEPICLLTEWLNWGKSQFLTRKKAPDMTQQREGLEGWVDEGRRIGISHFFALENINRQSCCRPNRMKGQWSEVATSFPFQSITPQAKLGDCTDSRSDTGDCCITLYCSTSCSIHHFHWIEIHLLLHYYIYP
jgi:hypothetical protein